MNEPKKKRFEPTRTPTRRSATADSKKFRVSNDSVVEHKRSSQNTPTSNSAKPARFVKNGGARRGDFASERKGYQSTSRQPGASTRSSKSRFQRPQRKAESPQNVPMRGGIGAASLWTKSTGKQSLGSQKATSIFGRIGSGLFTVLRVVFGVIMHVCGFLLSLIARSRIAMAICALLVVLLIAGLVDFVLTDGKVYAGVKVGEVDLGGKTAEEAQGIIDSVYTPRLSESEALVFANEEAMNGLESSLNQIGDANLSEQQSVEEALTNKTLWVANAEKFNATLDTSGLVKEAMSIGREDGGILSRIGAAIVGNTLTPRSVYDEELFEKFVSDIDIAIGDPRIDFGIAVSEGVVSVTEGHDGQMVERAAFKQEIDAALLDADISRSHLVAHAEFAPLRITREEAQRVCDEVSLRIAPGALFVCGEMEWTASGSDIGAWVKTNIAPDGEAFRLAPYLDQTLAKGIVLNHLKTNLGGDMLKVQFEKQGDTVEVHTDTNETIPLAGDALNALNNTLFGSDAVGERDIPRIEVGTKAIPEILQFDEAVENGIISKFSEFTTEYTVEPTTRQANIHLSADILSNSIIDSEGGSWSFNETAGDCNEEKGFQAAGAIVDGEFVDSIGGGICQVATTVFNVVYDSGFPVTSRMNHSLYIASYPAGRDAAVSWPDLDFVWQNDSSSDALLVMSHTDTTVTAALYGVNPEYKVSSGVGEWQAGEKAKTKTIVNEDMAPGASYVKTVGADGRNITIVRTVKDKNGALLHEDLFSSTYDPKDEVKVSGPPK